MRRDDSSVIHKTFEAVASASIVEIGRDTT